MVVNIISYHFSRLEWEIDTSPHLWTIVLPVSFDSICFDQLLLHCSVIDHFDQP